MTLSITDGELTGRISTAAGLQQNSKGMIDVYRGKAKRVGIDACVPASVGWKMLLEIMPTGLPLSAFQFDVGGMVAIDAQVPANVAAKVLAAAERAGVSVRR